MNKILDNLQFKVFTDIVEKSEKDGKRRIRGYASTDVLDRQGEVVSIEALRQAANHLLENPTVFYEHKHDSYPVGLCVASEIDDKGLLIDVEISETADTLWTLIQEGILNRFSIGGRVTSSEEKIGEDKKPYNEITGIELFEVSVVGLPANPEARFEVVNKSFSMAITDEIKKRKEGSEMKKEKESTSGSIEVDGTSDIAEIVESKTEKTEQKDEAKKEAKVEKTETPKEDKTTKEKPEEKKEAAQKKDLERYEKEDKEVAGKATEKKETTEKSQEVKPEEIVEMKTEKEVVTEEKKVVEGEKVEEQKEVVENTKEAKVTEEKVAEAETESVESNKVAEQNTGDVDTSTSDGASTIQINLLPNKKVDEAKPEVKEEKCEECVAVEEKPVEEKVEEKPETKADNSIVTDDEFEKLVVEDLSKPYPNEHAARVRPVGDFQEGSFRSKQIAEGIRIIIGRLKGKTTTTAQSYRFHVDHFTAVEAKQWLKDHKITYILFEPAKQEAGKQGPAPEILTKEMVDGIKRLEEKIDKILERLPEKALKIEEVKPEVEEKPKAKKKEEPKVEKKEEKIEEKPQRKSFIADAPYANDKKDKEKKEKDKNKPTEKGWSRIVYGS